MSIDCIKASSMHGSDCGEYSMTNTYGRSNVTVPVTAYTSALDSILSCEDSPSGCCQLSSGHRQSAGIAALQCSAPFMMLNRLIMLRSATKPVCSSIITSNTLGISSSCALQPLQNTTPKALYHSWLKLKFPQIVQPLIAGGADIAAAQHAAPYLVRVAKLALYGLSVDQNK
jgi:hypothetical protein